MLPGLYDDQRPTIARVAVMLIAGAALTIVPLTAQRAYLAGASSLHDVPARAAIAAPERLTFPEYTVTRDPFVPLRIDDAALVDQPSGTSPAATHVRAIVLGDPARALVEEGGSVRVVGIGDRVGNAQVLHIDAAAITLSDGTRLPLDGAHR